MKLIQDLVHMRGLEEETPGIPHRSCNTPCDASMYDDWYFDKKLPKGTCGMCITKKRGLLGGDCSEDQGEEIALGMTTRMCCVPFACKFTTTTTTTTTKK